MDFNNRPLPSDDYWYTIKLEDGRSQRTLRPQEIINLQNRIITTLILKVSKVKTLFGAYFMNRNHKTTIRLKNLLVTNVVLKRGSKSIV
jgi:hypothetical protein